MSTLTDGTETNVRVISTLADATETNQQVDSLFVCWHRQITAPLPVMRQSMTEYMIS